MKLLNEIQQKLKAPKSQNNDFGKYKYRSCEDILEAIKPLIGDRGILTISDEMVLIGDRYYIKATATLTEFLPENKFQDTTVSAYAREEENKKGMDSSQLTGSTSSYARKYALNGLFCIDDTKDSDHTNKHDKKFPLEDIIKDSKKNVKSVKSSKDKASSKELESKTEDKNDDIGRQVAAHRKAKEIWGGKGDEKLKEKLMADYGVESTKQISLEELIEVIRYLNKERGV